MPFNRRMMTLRRILGVDWGSKHIGLAISDPTQTIARTLVTLSHQSRNADARRIIDIATENQVELIVLGISYDDNGNLNPAGRSANRLLDEIRSLSSIPVAVYDEGFSTNEALESAIKMKIPRKKRRGHLDAAAAALILQHYLDEVADEK